MSSTSSGSKWWLIFWARVPLLVFISAPAVLTLYVKLSYIFILSFFNLGLNFNCGYDCVGYIFLGRFFFCLHFTPSSLMREIFSPILYSKLGLEGFDQQIKLLRWTGENFSPYFKLSLEGFGICSFQKNIPFFAFFSVLFLKEWNVLCIFPFF